MKIAVVGSHTDLRPGFSAAMSLNELAAFSSLGHDMTLYIPAVEAESFREMLDNKNVKTLDALDRFGLSFDIRPLSLDNPIAEDTDIAIWQTYDAADQPLLPCRGQFLLTKSFPRFAANGSERYRRKVKGTLEKFDILAMSLECDVDLLKRLSPAEGHRIGYVPRGFSSDWLTPAGKSDTPTFACDAAVKASDGGLAAVHHMKLLFEELERRGRRFNVIATRSAARILQGSIRIEAMPMLRYYGEFFSPAWIYLPCDLDHSIQSKNVDLDESGRPVYVGVFENQIVEAQMSGCVPVVQDGQIDPSIVFDEKLCVVRDYKNTALLADTCEEILASRLDAGHRARNFAKHQFSHTSMTDRWLRLIADNV